MIKLVMCKCKRCDKKLFTSKGKDHRLKGICSQCITQSEKIEILEYQGKLFKG